MKDHLLLPSLFLVPPLATIFGCLAACSLLKVRTRTATALVWLLGGSLGGGAVGLAWSVACELMMYGEVLYGQHPDAVALMHLVIGMCSAAAGLGIGTVATVVLTINYLWTTWVAGEDED
jgi:hypothetical protein